MAANLPRVPLFHSERFSVEPVDGSSPKRSTGQQHFFSLLGHHKFADFLDSCVVLKPCNFLSNVRVRRLSLGGRRAVTPRIARRWHKPRLLLARSR